MKAKNQNKNWILRGFQNTALREFGDLNVLLIDIMRPLLKFTGLTAETSFSSLSFVTFMTPVLTLPLRVKTTSRDIDLKLQEKLKIIS